MQNKSETPINRSRDIKCFRYQGIGHISSQCSKKRVMIMNSYGEYESESDRDDNGDDDKIHELEDPEEGYEAVVCEALVTRHIMSAQVKEEDTNQKENLFHTRCFVNEKVYSHFDDMTGSIPSIVISSLQDSSDVKMKRRASVDGIVKATMALGFQALMKHMGDNTYKLEFKGFPGASSSFGLNPGLKRDMPRSFSVKDGSQLPSKGIDSFMFPSKRKSIKNWFAVEKVKEVGKAVSKWFIYNAIPFNAADSGPYYQSMINAIAEAGTGIKGPSGRQIGGVYLQDEVDEINNYLNTLKSKWPKYGCTVMCDGWSTRNKHPIINFMIYCDRNMVFHSSVDCSNKTKTADFILSLLNKVIDEIGEENVVQVVTDSEGANKAAGAKLMMERPHLFWSPCAAHCLDLILEDVGKMEKVKKCIEKAKQITSFIHNSDKLVNLMKTFTNDRELLRPGITRFATEFISIESLDGILQI
ncbi:uncharacterized protein [Primulina eburnea]|uniref:uncharacterized protein n=1 Tax=Primulina eburnea TaxID=1245227 RepID=UPI003C6BEC9A